MLETLQGEGHVVTHRQLSRIRSKYGCLLRKDPLSKKRGISDVDGTSEVGEGNEEDHQMEDVNAPAPAPLPIEVQIERQESKAKLWAESAERLRNRTRRRRLKGWRGLPADAGLPPRFPSELTLVEGRELLMLDKQMYLDTRHAFEQICQEDGIERKTGCGEGQWPWAKEQLIEGSPHLQSIFNSPAAVHYHPNREPMALDLICMDVTKMMRNKGSHVPLADCKNTLNLTPDDSREARSIFQSILRADHFTAKSEVSKEHWDGLKERWVQHCPPLQRAFSDIQNNEEQARKIKALEKLARDAQKRNRDDQKKVGTTTSKAKAPATPRKAKAAKPVTEQSPTTASQRPDAVATTNQDASHSGIAELASQALAQEHLPPLPPTTSEDRMQIDPDLLVSNLLSLQSGDTTTTTIQPSNPSISIYMRPSPTTLSRFPSLSKVWLEVMTAPYTVATLRKKMLDKIFPDWSSQSVMGRTRNRNVMIQGIADGGASQWDIDEDDEVEAYLKHVGVGKKTFVLDVREGVDEWERAAGMCTIIPLARRCSTNVPQDPYQLHHIFHAPEYPNVASPHPACPPHPMSLNHPARQAGEANAKGKGKVFYDLYEYGGRPMLSFSRVIRL